MGQQQLLLLVLTTIIVGLAVVAGMEAYEESERQSAVNHITQRSIEIASDVQEYAARPEYMRLKNTTGDDELAIDFGELPQYDTNGASGGGNYIGELATYSLNGHSTFPSGYSPDACPNDNAKNTVEAYSTEHDVSVCVSITGTTADDLNAGVVE